MTVSIQYVDININIFTIRCLLLIISYDCDEISLCIFILFKDLLFVR